MSTVSARKRPGNEWQINRKSPRNRVGRPTSPRTLTHRKAPTSRRGAGPEERHVQQGSPRCRQGRPGSRRTSSPARSSRRRRRAGRRAAAGTGSRRGSRSRRGRGGRSAPRPRRTGGRRGRRSTGAGTRRAAISHDVEILEDGRGVELEVPDRIRKRSGFRPKPAKPATRHAAEADEPRGKLAQTSEVSTLRLSRPQLPATNGLGLR